MANNELIQMLDDLIASMELEYYDMNHDCAYSIAMIERAENIRKFVRDDDQQ